MLIQYPVTENGVYSSNVDQKAQAKLHWTTYGKFINRINEEFNCKLRQDYAFYSMNCKAKITNRKI